MNTFHHGGRIGDLIFALWTIRKLGGGILYLSDYHHPNWGFDTIESLRSLLESQSYISAVVPVPYKYMSLKHVDYDLQKAEDGPNGVTHIAERYARFFGLEYDGMPWLEVEPRRLASVTFHIPMRRSVRSKADWWEITGKLSDMAIIGHEDICGVAPETLLETAQYIAGADVFVGTVSSCNALAEALGKPNLVEQASGCYNVRPTLSLNGLSNGEVVAETLKRCHSSL